jgi:hypothetical protein
MRDYRIDNDADLRGWLSRANGITADASIANLATSNLTRAKLLKYFSNL